MLDTNIVSHAVRFPEEGVAARIAGGEAEGVSISIVVLAELRFGMLKRGADAQLARLPALLQLLRVEPLTSGVELSYARIRTMLERRGTPIGANDLFIAAHALTLGATLVTDDSEFARVEGLAVENWARD